MDEDNKNIKSSKIDLIDEGLINDLKYLNISTKLDIQKDLKK